ncbi:rrna small subunit methyltransferase i [hydrocarbon metagenome]|uniref:Rrna small subunit methyltransferase i n=1 Tax=hydrocarbon metagenome TaxID=938273 RepID=A0A0W8E8N8_9ZZZZ
MGKLFICGTPIGNLEDVSVRLLKTLRMVDLIACEDTRHTIKLLNRYKIKKKMISYHEHSGLKREEYILKQLLEGKNIALVSDAGMPGICDPGESLVQKVIENGLEIEVIPGPSAVVSALAVSGLDTSAFIFEGFLPRQTSQRIEALARNKEENRTVIYYETPHRLMKTLQDIQTVLGEQRKIVIVRELTKKHQEIIRGSIDEIIDRFKQQVPRGEFCLLIAGKVREQIKFDVDQLIEEVDELIEKGMDKKEAFKLKARQYKLQKSVVYKYYIERDL